MTPGGDRFRSILESRSGVLRRLVDSPATKSELVAALDVSRSTVDRAIRDLQTVECVARENGYFTATATGRLALEEHDRFSTRVDAIRDAQAFLDVLPDDAPLDAAMLDGASITLPDEHAPEEALKPSFELLSRSTSLRGTAPVVLSFYPDLFEAHVLEHDLTVESIAEEAVIATLPTMMSDRVEPFLQHENVSLYRVRESLPYALWLMETKTGTHAGITAYDSGGVAGVLINDSTPAVHWAETQYEQYRERAEPVDTSSL